MDQIDRLERDLIALREAVDRMGVHSAVVDEKLLAIQQDIHDLRQTQTNHFVSIARYSPVERIVYGVVGLLLTGLVGAVLALILR